MRKQYLHLINTNQICRTMEVICIGSYYLMTAPEKTVYKKQCMKEFKHLKFKQ